MPRAVRFDEYGGTDVLNVVEVERPKPGPGQLLLRVKAAGINPGEAKIREGLLHSMWPATFPSGQGSDLAGTVEETGEGVSGFAPGDEIIGYTDERASQAEYAVIGQAHATPKPPGLSWEVAGSLFVVGATAVAAIRAISVSTGDTVVISGAAGGVGSIAVQLAKLEGATVIGLASEPNHEWLRSHGAIPVAYAQPNLKDRIIDAANGTPDAFFDTVGGDYVELALELGIKPERIDTIANFAAAEKYGVKIDGNAAGASKETLAELAKLVDEGRLEIPIANVYPLDQVRAAYEELAKNHTRGKIVLTL
jgi:NADPH:quinone reductase-like Zn-dependent oxidoreductase